MLYFSKIFFLLTDVGHESGSCEREDEGEGVNSVVKVDVLVGVGGEGDVGGEAVTVDETSAFEKVWDRVGDKGVGSGCNILTEKKQISEFKLTLWKENAST